MFGSNTQHSESGESPTENLSLPSQLLHQLSHWALSDLGPNCLQRLLPEDTSLKRVKKRMFYVYEISAIF